MKLSHLLESDYDIALLWEQNFQRTQSIVLATTETCLQTQQNHRTILEIVSRHIREQNIILLECRK
jgi:hypothetical protein